MGYAGYTDNEDYDGQLDLQCRKQRIKYGLKGNIDNVKMCELEKCFADCPIMEGSKSRPKLSEFP